ncbi:MAG TPA: SpoIIE family protein phosphatase [Bacteroidales bacterium]|jgi:serine phosphatase RsbU (regulator of sigma subunit)|nr:SpoIIE family protein phosphatase [Bacteroidales bacterium]
MLYHVLTYHFILAGKALEQTSLQDTFPWASGAFFRILVFGIIAVALVYLILRLQTRLLIQTRRLLKEKEQALETVDRQKAELELKDKNLIDSLIYAQRIQEALLPSEDYFRQRFQDSFILFMPKDIVSGDFYWIGENDDKIFVVAADCTGHGVPGALMSMIGHEIIEKTINDDHIQDPARILAILNKALEKTFSREKNIGTIIRDGMDVGLCIIEKKLRKLHYAGAFFPLYLIRKSTLTEIRGDKLIIGMNPEGHRYTETEYDLMDDDVLYIFSDGYVDQFGGEDNKKFMYRRFRYLLLNIHKLPFSDQKVVLEDNIRNWMGRNVQVDDIMVIGFRPLSAGTI